jgi:hypothetical protein
VTFVEAALDKRIAAVFVNVVYANLDDDAGTPLQLEGPYKGMSMMGEGSHIVRRAFQDASGLAFFVPICSFDG